MLGQNLTRTELIGALELVQACLGCASEDDVRKVVLASRRLIPFQAAMGGVAPLRGDPAVGFRLLNVDYPVEYLSEFARRGLIASDPAVREHLRSFRLQYFGDTLARLRPEGEAAAAEIISLAEDFGFRTLASGWGYGHGVRDPAGAQTTMLFFHGLPRSQRTEEMLELLVPHLHQAILRAEPSGVRDTGRSKPADRASLSARELEVLRWVRQGKGTWEISAILSISERTVKFHVASVMRKLDATTRAHAVAIALDHRLLQID